MDLYALQRGHSPLCKCRVDLPVIKMSGTITDAKGIGVANIFVGASSERSGRSAQTESSSRSYVSTAVDGSYSFVVFAGNREQSIGPSERGYPRVVINSNDDSNAFSEEIVQRVLLQAAR